MDRGVLRHWRRQEVRDIPSVLLLDAYLEDPGGGRFFEPWLAGVDVQRVRVAQERLPDPTGHQAVIVTGSAGSVLDDEPWVGRLLEFLRGALAADAPVLGVCFGHQALAAAVHGRGGVFRRTTPEIGFSDVHLDSSDPLLSVLGERVRAFVTHEDEVARVPTLLHLGRTDACPTHALRVPGRRAWGVQFHLEYPHEEVRRILEYRRERHPELGLRPDAAMTTAPDTSASARALFGRFLELAC